MGEINEIGISLRVRDILSLYDKGGMPAVTEALMDSKVRIEENSWHFKIKSLISAGRENIAEAEIASLIFIFKLNKEDEGTRREHPGLSDQGSEDGRDIRTSE